jgi:hypothetical protein
MEVPIDLTNALVEVTYEQHGQVVCQVDNEQMTITPTKLTWTLLPQQTLAMEVGDIRIQLHYTNGTVTDYSDIHYGKVLYSRGVEGSIPATEYDAYALLIERTDEGAF